MSGAYFPSSALRPTRRSSRTHCRKSKWALRSWNASWAREGSCIGVRSHSGRLLRAAEHVCLRTDEGRTGHVSEIPGLLPMAGADGGTSDRANVSRRIAAARSHRACAALGGFASAQILIGRRRRSHARQMEDRMKWITREHVKVDRVACPWLIKKFVDRDAEFIFVPADKVVDEAKRLDATLYDVKNVELGHHGKECSFEAILKKYKLSDDPALVLLGKIVNGADTDNTLYQQPEAPGLEAIA